MQRTACSVPSRVWVVLLLVAGALRPVQAQDTVVVIRRIEDSLLPRVLVAGEAVPPRSLADRMAQYRLPGVSVAVIDGRGAAIMTNSDRGADVAREILGTLAVAYGWPDFAPATKTVASVDPAGYAALAGTYRVEGRDLEAVISVEDARLYVSGTGIPRMELLPESELVFFSREDGTSFTFVRANGAVVALRAMGLRAEKVR